MNSTIVRRLEKLQSKFAGGPCNRCGGPDDPGEPVTYEVVWDHDVGDDLEEEFCPECGQRTTVTVTWMDDLNAPSPPGGSL